MTKLEWIRSQIEAGVTDFGALNTPALVANPIPQGTVPKPLAILDVAVDFNANDRRLLQNEGAYNSLITNINKGDLSSTQADIQNLITTPGISQGAINTLNAALLATIETIPDPNWQPEVWLTPAQQAGFDAVTVQEWMEAKK